MKSQTKKLTGELLAKTAVNQILGHPETWDQKTWHSSCGTKHCFAGWCQILSGKLANDDTAQKDAAEALGLTEFEAQWYFRPNCSLGELHYLAANFNRDGFDGDGFDRDGFDRDGFDRDGFDGDGFDRDGFNRDGFNRAGFDRAGFNRAGFDRAGFDRDGFNRDGFDRAGFDRAGFDRAGFDRAGKKLQPFEI